MPSEHFPGRYHDGRHARADRVQIVIGGSAIDILASDGTLLDRWPSDQVRLSAPADTHGPIRLQHTDNPARLAIRDPRAYETLKLYCTNLGVGITTSRREWSTIGLWSAAAVAVVVAIFLFVIPAGSAWFAVRIPPPLEVRLGKNIARQLTVILAATQARTESEITCTSPGGDRVLADIASRLEQAAQTHLPITVTVIDHPMINAFALPGGQILLFRGLIENADSAEEVVGVLAHEVGHVLHRHPTEIALKNTAGAGLVSILVGDFTGGAALAAATQLLLTSSNTRDAERQADATAVQLLNDLGISAEPLASFFTKTDTDTESLDGILGYLSTHPADADRAATIRALNTSAGPSMTDQQWQALQQICD